MSQIKKAPTRRLKLPLLSRLADVNYKTVAGLIKDPYRDVEVRPLYKIAKALGVELGDLIEEVPD